MTQPFLHHPTVLKHAGMPQDAAAVDASVQAAMAIQVPGPKLLFGLGCITFAVLAFRPDDEKVWWLLAATCISAAHSALLHRQYL